MAEDGWLPWKAPIDVLKHVSRTAVTAVVSGGVGLILGPLLDLLTGGPSIEEILRQAVERFAEVVHEEFNAQKLEEAENHLDHLKTRLQSLQALIEARGEDSWWNDTYAPLLLNDLDDASSLLVETLNYHPNSPELARWVPWIAAASLRLLVLGIHSTVPTYEYRRKELDAAIKDFAEEHCARIGHLEYFRVTCMGSECEGPDTERFRWYVHQVRSEEVTRGVSALERQRIPPCGFYFEVKTAQLLDHLRGFGLSDERWLSMMPPAGDLYKWEYPRKWFKSSVFGGNGAYWFVWFDSALLVVPHDDPQALLRAYEELAEWIREVIRRKFLADYNEVVHHWWAGLYPVHVKTIALRTKHGNYLVADQDKLGYLSIGGKSLTEGAKFEYVRWAKGEVLRAYNGLYVYVDSDLCRLRAGADCISDDRVHLKFIGDECTLGRDIFVGLRCANGSYATWGATFATEHMGPGRWVHAVAHNIGPTSRFQIINLEDFSAAYCYWLKELALEPPSDPGGASEWVRDACSGGRIARIISTRAMLGAMADSDGAISVTRVLSSYFREDPISLREAHQRRYRP